MKLLLPSLLLCSQIVFGQLQSTFLLVGTRNAITFTYRDGDRISFYWNGDTNRTNELEQAGTLDDGTMVYYELTSGKRTARLTIAPLDSTQSTGYDTPLTGTYKLLKDGRTIKLYSNSIYAAEGRWNVTMNAAESNCPESPSGQQRTEIWRISTNLYQTPIFSVSVSDNAGATISTYRGEFDGAYLRLKAVINGSLFSAKAKATVTLLLENNNTLSGIRRLDRSDPCSIRSTILARRLN